MSKRNDLKTFLLFKESHERRTFEGSYYDFFKAAWPILEPSNPFIDNWHFKYICGVLQQEIERISRGEEKTTDLIFNVPPRSGKSMMVSIMLCPWAWIRFPWMRFINSSYDRDLSTDHLVNSRDVIQSGWYQRMWSKRFQMAGDQNLKGFFRNTSRGYRIAASVGGGVAGKGADVIIADDLVNPKSSYYETERDGANRHYDQDLYNRLNNPNVGLRIIIAQRTHEDDTSGHAMKMNPDGYRRIVIPADDEFPVFPEELAKNYG